MRIKKEYIEFGTEVMVSICTYKISATKIKELSEQYGHSLSLRKLEIINSENEQHDVKNGIVINRNDLVFLNKVTNPCVVIKENFMFGSCYVLAHKQWNLSNINVLLNENAQEEFYINEYGKEWDEFYFHSKYFIESICQKKTEVKEDIKEEHF